MLTAEFAAEGRTPEEHTSSKAAPSNNISSSGIFRSPEVMKNEELPSLVCTQILGAQYRDINQIQPQLEKVTVSVSPTRGRRRASSLGDSPTSQTSLKLSRRATGQQHQDLPKRILDRDAPSQHKATLRCNSKTEQEEDGGSEHISSAVYFPHRKLGSKHIVSSEPLNEIERQPTKDVLKSRSFGVAPPITRDGTMRNHDEPKIAFSIQSEDDSRCLHGEFPHVEAESQCHQYETHDLLAEHFVSASDSEWVLSEDEEGHAREHELSEGAATPRPETARKEQNFHKHRQALTPPQAIELKPFNHQVGGHTAIYRFSRRAVCKKLNNKENKFYETVERYHPDLLDFLPRLVCLRNVQTWGAEIPASCNLPRLIPVYLRCILKLIKCGASHIDISVC